MTEKCPDVYSNLEKTGYTIKDEDIIIDVRDSISDEEIELIIYNR